MNYQLAYSFCNLAPDEDLSIRSKYRASPVNRDVRNYNQISFTFGIINYMQQSAETPTHKYLFLFNLLIF